MQRRLWSGAQKNRLSSALRLGALAPTDNYATLAQGGFGSVTIEVPWVQYEPNDGVFATAKIVLLQQKITEIHGAGLEVVLDIGLQYPPDWVFSIAHSRYKNQYGDELIDTTDSGYNIVNGVLNLQVRQKMQRFIVYLASNLTDVAIVRVGAGPYNELSYPFSYTGGRSAAMWFYDGISQQSLPTELRGWLPGTGTAEQAAQFYGYYSKALMNYGSWLTSVALTAFPARTHVAILLPGWGIRSGQVAAAAANRLIGAPEEIYQALDWPYLFTALPGSSRVIAYSTYADASNGTVANPAPSDYIAAIAPSHFQLGGESTGKGNTTDAGMALMFQRAKRQQWRTVHWFFVGQSQTTATVGTAFNAAR